MKQTPAAPAPPVPSPPPPPQWGYGGEAETIDSLPQIGIRRNDHGGTPLGERNEPWYWVANPLAWQVLDGRVVPSLRKIILHAGGGIGNVDTIRGADGRAQAEPSLALSRAALKGETVLDFHDPRTFVDTPGGRKPYLMRVKATGGYISRFETVYGGTDAVTTDTQAFAAWLSRLIDDGVLPPPPVHQLHRLEGVISRQIVQYRDRGGVKAAYASRVAKLERDLEVVRAALEAHRARAMGGAPAETDEDLPPPPPAKK